MTPILRIIPALILLVMATAMTGALFSIPVDHRTTLAQLENGLEDQIERRLEEKGKRRRQKEQERQEEQRRAREEAEKSQAPPEEKEPDTRQEDDGFGDFNGFGEEGSGDLDDFSTSPSGLFFSGLLRNDAYLADPPELHHRTYPLFHDILEMRLIGEARNEHWKFYTDARFFYYNGEIATYLPSNYDIKLLRAFVRYTVDKHEITIGKTYINFGNAGLFNPFELDKSVQMTDLQYSREGNLAFEYILHWQDAGSLKFFGGVPATPFDYTFLWGMSPSLHIGKFNVGAVILHKKENLNSTGIYFKGDLFIGVDGSIAWHVDNATTVRYIESNLGADYSITEDLLLSMKYYYNGNGADDPDLYTPSPDQFLLARHYLFGAVNYSVDEFLSFQLGTFYNIVDNSMIFLPAMNLVVANGLTSMVQLIIPTGDKNTEFSRNTSGKWTLLLRMESKF